tara:strand:- start:477 stop:1175 length:699 start_codon:yes stop_codon:yes gene_type:complete
MSILPKLETAKYDVVVPSSGLEVQIRPFLVKEEKLLMLAQESKSAKQIVRTMQEIISACSFNTINTSELTSYDVEFLFLRLRAVSVGETADLKFKCENDGAENEVQVNLMDIEVKYPEKKVSNRIQLTDDIGVVLKPLSLDTMAEVDANEDIVKNICTIIDSIYDADNVYPAKDTPEKDLMEFIESLNHHQIEEIQEYLTNQPKLSHTIEYKCAECGHLNTVVLEGLQSFFT